MSLLLVVYATVLLLLTFGVLFGIYRLNLLLHAGSLRVSNVLVLLLVALVQLSWTCIISCAIHLLTHDLGKGTTSASASEGKDTLWFLGRIIRGCLLHCFNRRLLESSWR